jgi:hypothetical protein
MWLCLARKGRENAFDVAGGQKEPGLAPSL